MRVRAGFVLLLCCCFAGERNKIVVIAHRGEHLRHPENTIAAFQAAGEAGADFFELDVRTTSDGKLVLMHDADVSRTTNGRGEVARLTFDEIRMLNAGGGERVPSFDEALEFARQAGIGVYVDSKRISPADAIAAIERHEMGRRVVIYGGVGYLKGVAAERPSWKVMPEADNPEKLKSMLETMSLKVVAFDNKDFNGATIEVARKAGVDKMLIYRYFNDLPGLVRSIAFAPDFFPSFENIIGDDIDALKALPVGKRAAEVLERNTAAMMANPVVLELMVWELVERNELTAIMEEAREKMGRRLMAEVFADVEDRTRLAAISAVLAAGMTYLALRARKIRWFGGVDLKSEQGWKSINAAIEAMAASAAEDVQP